MNLLLTLVVVIKGILFRPAYWTVFTMQGVSSFLLFSQCTDHKELKVFGASNRHTEKSFPVIGEDINWSAVTAEDPREILGSTLSIELNSLTQRSLLARPGSPLIIQSIFRSQ